MEVSRWLTSTHLNALRGSVGFHKAIDGEVGGDYADEVAQLVFAAPILRRLPLKTLLVNTTRK